ncbi:GNAT family N-acetyltransferase [Fusobacteria bacterium ZRK30]|nr:GNAT family N-acetyltransferase [Fusobacteria bacterium ZRK30]
MIVREVLLEDAEKYLQMLKILDEQTNFLMFEPGERKTTLEDQKNIIKYNVENKIPMFLMEIEGEIVGFLKGVRYKCNRMNQNLHIALGILSSYRGKGGGKALMNKVDQWSQNNNIKRMELTVACENKKAVNLYKSMGFEIEGIKRSSFKLEDKFLDQYYMGKVY